MNMNEEIAMPNKCDLGGNSNMHTMKLDKGMSQAKAGGEYKRLRVYKSLQKLSEEPRFVSELKTTIQKPD